MTPDIDSDTVVRWNGDLTEAERAALEAHAERTQSALQRAMDDHPDWSVWRAEGLFIRDALIAQAPLFGRVLLEYEEKPHSVPLAGLTYRHMLFALFKISEPVVIGGRPTGTSSAMGEAVAFLRPRLRSLTQKVLASVGYPDDQWHQLLAAGLLIEPGLANWARPLAPSLVRAGEEGTPWRRNLSLPGGIPEHVARAGVGLLLALQRRHGVRSPIPRQGDRRVPNGTRRDFVEYVASRRRAGVSVEFIAQDAEAARLYRAWKPRGVPTERVIRVALQRATRQSR